MPGAMFAQGMNLALRVLARTSETTWTLPAVLVLMDSHTQSSLPLLQRISTLQMSTAIPSFEIAPLGELLNMFENHEATDQRDKIYALLGLSSDNASTPDLRPDYTKSWSTLFKQVASHILGSSATISVVEGKSQAVVSEFGSALGLIADCKQGRMTVESPQFGSASRSSYLWEASWLVPHERGRCKRGDILIHLQGARRPCVVRPCGDHFDIVLVSLPEPRDIRIIELPVREPEVILESIDDGWADLMRRARNTSRKFTLVWDWSTGGQHDHVNHVVWIESDPGCHPSGIERSFNTARVLDDMTDYSGLLQLLQARPPPAGSAVEEKHLALLNQVCTLWDDYLEIKGYLAEVSLCIWSLNAPINYSHIYDYWIDRGYLGPDLFDIVALGTAVPEAAVVSTVRNEPYVPMLDPFRNPLLPMLFPQYQPVKLRERGTILSTRRAVSLHSGRFLIRLLLRNATELVQPSDGILDKLHKDHIMAPRSILVRSILTEHESTHLDPIKAMQRLFGRAANVLNVWYLQQLLGEFSFDAALIYELLEYLAFYTQEWPSQQFKNLRIRVMDPLVGIFVRHIKALSYLEFGLWAGSRRPFHSVLSFLYDLYDAYRSAPCFDVSKHLHLLPFSRAEKAEWAQKAILRVISSLRQELRPDDLSSSDDEDPLQKSH
jgi:hypothetical protein